MSGRPCEDGECLATYECHPETNRCVPAIRRDCSDPDAYCPSTTQTGDPCAEEGAFLPCADTVTDCRRGCRTCVDGAWSECTPGECVLGTIHSCADCDDDCTALAFVGEVACDTTATPAECVIQSCQAGHVDRDGKASTGCESPCNYSGEEVCDGDDNNCNGWTDDVDQSVLDNQCDASFPDGHVQTWACLEGICATGICADDFWDLDGPTTVGCEYPCVYQGEEDCAPADLDCDGDPNNGFDHLGESCGQGDCAGGHVVCDADGTGTHCSTDMESSPEICDNRDNDCNGVIDNDLGAACYCTDGVQMPLDVEVCGTGGGNGVDENCNDAVDEGCSCLPSETIRAEVIPMGCDHVATGEWNNNLVIFGLLLTPSCDHPTLDELSLTWIGSIAHTQASPLTFKLWHDVNADGQKGGLDVQVSSDESFSSPTLTFSNINLNFDNAVPLQLLVTVDVPGTFSTDCLFGVSVDDPSDIRLTNAAGSVVLEQTPLRDGVLTVSAPGCSDLNRGPGSLALAAANSVRANSGDDWFAEPDPSIDCTTESCDPDGSATSNCDLDDDGNPDTIQLTDKGTDSHFLHLATPLPLGLPLCGVTLRLFATMSQSDATSCRPSTELFADFTPSGSLEVRYYVDTTNVGSAAYSLPVAATSGPASPDGCATDFVDLDVTTIYEQATVDGAQSLDHLELRVMVDSGSGLNQNGNQEIAHVPEIYMRVESP